MTMLVCHFNILFLLALCSVGVVHSFAVRGHETNKKGHKTHEDRTKNALVLVKPVAAKNLKNNTPPCSSNAYQVFDNHLGKNFSCKPCDEVVLKCPDEHEIFPKCGHVVTKEELAHAECRPVNAPIKEDTASKEPVLSQSNNSGFSKNDKETSPKGVTEESDALIYEEKETRDAGVRENGEERGIDKLQTVNLEEPERPNKSRSVMRDGIAELTDVDDKVVSDKNGELGRLQQVEDYDDGIEKDAQDWNASLILIEEDVVMDMTVELRHSKERSVEKMRDSEAQKGPGLAFKEKPQVPEDNWQGNEGLGVQYQAQGAKRGTEEGIDLSEDKVKKEEPQKVRQGNNENWQGNNKGLKVQNYDQGVEQDRGQKIDFPEDEKKKDEPQKVREGNNENAGKEKRDLEVTSKQEAEEGRIGSENLGLTENTERQTESRKESEGSSAKEKNGTGSDVHVARWTVEQEESTESKEKQNNSVGKGRNEEKMEKELKESKDDKKQVRPDNSGLANNTHISRKRTSKRGRKEEKSTIRKRGDTRSDTNDKQQSKHEAVDQQTADVTKKGKESGERSESEENENSANKSPRVMVGNDLAVLKLLVFFLLVIVLLQACVLCKHRIKRAWNALIRGMIACLWRCTSDVPDFDDSNNRYSFPDRCRKDGITPRMFDHIRISVDENTPRVSRKLSDLAEDLNGPYDEVCARLDTRHDGYGCYYDVLRHFGKKPWEIRSRFETHVDGPSVALFEWLRTAKPKMTIKTFNHVLIKRGINRKEIILLLKGFDLSQQKLAGNG